MKQMPCFLFIFLSLNEIPFQVSALGGFSSAFMSNCEHGHVFHRIHDGRKTWCCAMMSLLSCY